jgi:hypothetical protein
MNTVERVRKGAVLNRLYFVFADGWKLSAVLHNTLVVYGYSVGKKVCWKITRYSVLALMVMQNVHNFIFAEI